MKTIHDVVKGLIPPKGKTTIFSFNPETMAISQLVHEHNQIMNDAVDVLGNLLFGFDAYKISTMYFEYVNLASPTDSPNPPSFNASDNVSYYTGLRYSTDRDFLRVPVVSSGLLTTTSTGKLASFYAVTPGSTQGYWGKAFSAANNSAVYGGALVSTPTPSDQASDKIFARNYPTGAKVLKPTGEQICMIWNLEISNP